MYLLKCLNYRHLKNVNFGEDRLLLTIQASVNYPFFSVVHPRFYLGQREQAKMCFSHPESGYGHMTKFTPVKDH